MALRIRRAIQPLSERWREGPVEVAGSTRLGISFRPRQAEAFGLDVAATRDALLSLPFRIVRLGAYWNRIEPRPNVFQPDELDGHVDAADRAGREIIIGLGAVKTFGYPELFVPTHHLAPPLREGTLISETTHPALLRAAVEHVIRLVERYRDRHSVIAWQVEHEAVDPLGLEHSWRLSTGFVQAEVDAVRRADPQRPIILNGYLPMSLVEAVPQWFRTRNQGDSLALAQRLGDITGIDAYPCHALAVLSGSTLYLDRGRRPWPRRALAPVESWARSPGHRVMVTEGQAEPWEGVTTPPNPAGAVPSSCPPERLIETYNQAMRWAKGAGIELFAYLFWGAEYWILRERAGDPRYRGAIDRILAMPPG